MALSSNKYANQGFCFESMKLAQSKKKYADPTRKAYPYYIRTFMRRFQAQKLTRFRLLFSLSSDGHVKDDLPPEDIAGHAKRLARYRPGLRRRFAGARSTAYRPCCPPASACRLSSGRASTSPSAGFEQLHRNPLRREKALVFQPDGVGHKRAVLRAQVTRSAEDFSAERAVFQLADERGRTYPPHPAPRVSLAAVCTTCGAERIDAVKHRARARQSSPPARESPEFS